MSDARLEHVLSRTFGLPEFRPGQREVIDAVLAGRPTVAVMPTGAGKSLCFQLPAVVLGGTALVVSPLIALMKDQVDALVTRGVRAASLTSALDPVEQSERLAALAGGRLQILYVAPERFKSPRFRAALAQAAGRLSLVAVDEAHCISEWGHDFRPDYLRLGPALAELAPPRRVALTATATPEVRADITRLLHMEDAAVFVRGFDRPNLDFVVEHVGGKRDKEARLLDWVRQRNGGSALVYAATRKNAERYAAALTAGGVRAGAYHAGLDDELRKKIQDRFMDGTLEAVVATNAFGMGIDKADVRVVVHADIPRSPEAYYQEAGRAGRDGDAASAVLLFQAADIRLQEFLIDAGCPTADLLRSIWRAVRDDPRAGSSTARLRRALDGSPSEAAVDSGVRYLLRAGYLVDQDGVVEAVDPREAGAGAVAPIDAGALDARVTLERKKLRAMIQYAYGPECRRRYLLRYFGDQDARERLSCAGCDICRTPADAREATVEEEALLRTVLALVQRLDGRFGKTRLARILTGKDDNPRTMHVPEHGALRLEPARYVMDVLAAAEAAGLCETSRGEYPTLATTERGRRVLRGREVVQVRLPAKVRAAARRRPAPSAAAGAEGPADAAVVARLRAFRAAAAAREQIPPYCVFPDGTLFALAEARPRSRDALASIPGIGPSRLDKYGEAILSLLADAG